jgi:hypothetical protein
VVAPWRSDRLNLLAACPTRLQGTCYSLKRRCPPWVQAQWRWGNRNDQGAIMQLANPQRGAGQSPGPVPSASPPAYQAS